MHQYRKECDLLNMSSVEEDLEVVVANKLAMRQKYSLVAKKISGTVGCIKKKKCGQQGDDPLPLLCTGEATYGVLCQVLGSSAQERQRTTGESPAEGHKVIRDLEHFPYGEKSRDWGLFRLEKTEWECQNCS